MSTSPIVDQIVTAYHARLAELRSLGHSMGKPSNDHRIDERRKDSARHAVSTVVGPLMQGVWQWLVLPCRGESIRAYARRASRCAAGRCAESGVPAPAAIAHDGVETIGMLAAYGQRSAVRDVSEIEIAVGGES